jgi:hypothetical protein
MITFVVLRSHWDRLRFRFGQISSASGATTVHRPLEESFDYIRHQVDDWLLYAGLTPQRLRGARVVELGPGDNVGVALRLLAMGAAEVHCLDKYFPPHDTDRERRLYQRIREDLNAEERDRFDEAVTLEPALRFNEKRLRYVYGKGSEEADQVVDSDSANIVLSRGVLQGVNAGRSLAAVHRILKPGGLTAHKIDLRDYGIFSANGHHPLEFLTLPDWLYWLMSHNADRPNRKHINFYRERCAEQGWEIRLYLCGLIVRGYTPFRDFSPYVEHLQEGVHYSQADLEMVRAIRPRLTPEFAGLTDEELMTSSIFLVANKPDAPRR